MAGDVQIFGLKLNVQVQYKYVEANMASSHRLTCLKIEGNNLLKNKVSRLTLPSLLPMIRCSDGPKSYWGYYQTYLVQISGNKSKKKITLIFSQKSKNS